MSYLNWLYKNHPVRVSKHGASKKKFAHKKNPSRGELNHQKFLALEKIKESPNLDDAIPNID